MARKKRNELTIDVYNVIVRMAQDERNTIKIIAGIVGFDLT